MTLMRVNLGYPCFCVLQVAGVCLVCRRLPHLRGRRGCGCVCCVAAGAWVALAS